MDPVYEIYAIRYATMTGRTPHMNFLVPDPHDTIAADLDYFVWLIRGEGRQILVDTGFNEVAAKERARKLTLNPVDALAKFGVRAEDIKDVVITHMHYDHAGNLDRFPNAKFHAGAPTAVCTCVTSPAAGARSEIGAGLILAGPGGGVSRASS